MQVRHWLLLAALGLASAAHADEDWLAGEYAVRPTWSVPSCVAPSSAGWVCAGSRTARPS